MHRAAVCCFVTLTVATSAALGQRSPTRSAPPPGNRPAPRQPAPAPQAPATAKPSQRPQVSNAAGDSGPVRPAGFKPITLATAQKEAEGLRASIAIVEERIRKFEADPVAMSDEPPRHGASRHRGSAAGTTHTRSQASGGIHFAGLPFHFTLQPIGLVTSTGGRRPASTASTASTSSWVFSAPGVRGLSSILPV